MAQTISGREVLALASRLVKATEAGPATGHTDRICALFNGICPGVTSSMSTSGGPRSVALTLISLFNEGQHENLTRVIEEIGRLETELAKAANRERVEYTGQIKCRGSQVVDGNTIYTLVLHQRPLRPTYEDLIKEKRVILTCRGALSPLLPVAGCGDTVTVTYLKNAENDPVAGDVIAITLKIEFNPELM